jgi:uncharacterized protein
VNDCSVWRAPGSPQGVDLLESAATMPRSLLKRIASHRPHLASLHGRWYLRIFGTRIADPRLWSLQRRSVTGGVSAGLAICFVPLPVHTLLAILCAIVWRLNVATVIATTLIVNPFTAVPIYYGAYRVGSALVGTRPHHHFGFHLSWDWLQHGLGPMWKPFLIGCLTCAIVCSIAARLLLELLWRWSIVNRRARARRPDSSAAD